MIRISDAELEVMKVIWEKKEATSLEIIKGITNKEWTFNTIRTLIRRLQEKGAVDATKGEQNIYVYKPLIDQNEYRYEMTKELIKKLFHNSINEFLIGFCKSGDLTAKDIQKLIDEIDRREKMKKEKNTNN